MIMQQADVYEYLKQREKLPLLDVRSPAEYAEGHIPGANNMPLFSNAERKQVGITYKHEGQRAAIKLGLKIVGPKMKDMVDFAETFDSEKFAVHCWRGGMRSASVAWLLETAGFEVTVISGGYKSFRRALTEYFTNPLPLMVLGGKTGSGKTGILHDMSESGEQVIDLEGLARHRGSAFGSFGLPPQPSTEQFQNELFIKFQEFDQDRTIWVEDESSNIGKVGLPEGLWRQMSRAPMIMLDIPLEERVNRLVREYGEVPREQLELGIRKISKKLGGLNLKKAIESLDKGRLDEVAEILLGYYDKSYGFLEQKRNQKVIATIKPDTSEPDRIAETIIQSVNSYSV
ncbi:MAG: tRNA 2-selenouridine(34) synthase MnmH [Cyclobacteriaceae bacterium]